ncbi:hypothetical protein ASPWEDRAFT_569530 [Aspergillus wentii DTO 134E9]|uniref:Uncharacterized protein n=1 Tax=Aspergillus wentii DTO 134E9 TaxID=1073089 RepID=A0A1L9RH73_ASPWE|nr:uncharacterized protein ASPWEDRAFT_569530 [Aspergillus wentii DTO 134E9]OJJ34254.1 hypothetical protein ASPWEDRAFT_569530 [Aspergillus wentii DTO 134E9]
MERVDGKRPKSQLVGMKRRRKEGRKKEKKKRGNRRGKKQEKEKQGKRRNGYDII